MIYGKDYTKSTSPTARMESKRIVCHIAAALDWELYQINVKTPYLYGDLEGRFTWTNRRGSKSQARRIGYGV